VTQRTVALYLRVSTGEQTVENQRRDLEAAVERRGWRVVAEFCDEGISGANGRDKRPGFDKLCRAILRHQFDIVAAWSVDRLGRSLQDLVGSSENCTAPGLTSTSIARASIPARRQARRCFRCWACSRSSSARSSKNASPRASPGRARRARRAGRRSGGLGRLYGLRWRRGWASAGRRGLSALETFLRLRGQGAWRES
jgi:DNA invertase Pin-like site-specific DNA recombinase